MQGEVDVLEHLAFQLVGAHVCAEQLLELLLDGAHLGVQNALDNHALDHKAVCDSLRRAVGQGINNITRACATQMSGDSNSDGVVWKWFWVDITRIKVAHVV